MYDYTSEESNDLSKYFLRPLGPGDPTTLSLSFTKALVSFSNKTKQNTIGWFGVPPFSIGFSYKDHSANPESRK